ncbi:hypothetical protein BC829DRAFT_415644 [Chytridium lagenaria]|nr:hypothetical protein BC829DRAFT_415644 [Chytridium lagenaria]
MQQHAKPTSPAIISTPWPCPPTAILSLTQIFAHFASTSIMTLLVLFSFFEDFKKWLKGAPAPSPSRVTAIKKTSLRVRKSGSEEEEEDGSSTAIDSSDDREDSDNGVESVGKKTGSASMLSAFIPKSLRTRRVSEPSQDEALFFATRRTTMDVRDYCAHAGYCCDTFETITKMASSSSSTESLRTIASLHSSGVWVTNGMHSLAFYLVDQGFDVWMGNNRTCIEQHVNLKPSDTEFWNWSLDELARYDFPATLDLVRRETATTRSSLWVILKETLKPSLSMMQNPAVSAKISLFVALAPAVYIGSLLETFPVCLLMDCPADLFRVLFGVKAFLPIMTFVQKFFPPYLFATLAYHMFHYLFGWTDTNWDPRNKSSYFQFTPRPQSSKAIHHCPKWVPLESSNL